MVKKGNTVFFLLTRKDAVMSQFCCVPDRKLKLLPHNKRLTCFGKMSYNFYSGILLFGRVMQINHTIQLSCMRFQYSSHLL